MPRRAGGRRLRGRRGRRCTRDRVPIPAHRRAPPPARRRGTGPHGARRPGLEGLSRAGAGFPGPADGDALRALRRRSRPSPSHRKGHPRTTVLQAAARGLRRQHGPQGGSRTQLPGRERARPGVGRRRGAARRFRLRRRRPDPPGPERAHPWPHALVEADAATAASLARLALRVAGPRPGSRRASDPRRRPPPARPARDRVSGSRQRSPGGSACCSGRAVVSARSSPGTPTSSTCSTTGPLWRHSIRASSSATP